MNQALETVGGLKVLNTPLYNFRCCNTAQRPRYGP